MKMLRTETVERLIRTIWGVAYTMGFDHGQESATAYEWGYRSQKPSNAKNAWDEKVQWLIDTDTDMHLDIFDPEFWSKV